MKNIFDLIFEVVGWVLIALSPLLIGALLGVIIYFNMENTVGLVLAIITAVAGLIAALFWRKKGTIFFLSRTMATPEFDKEESDENLTK